MLKQMKFSNSPTTRDQYYQLQHGHQGGLVSYPYEDSNTQYPSLKQEQPMPTAGTSATMWYNPMMTPSPLPTMISTALGLPHALGTLAYPTTGLGPGVMKTVCSYFLKGNCRYGDMCHNIHPSTPMVTTPLDTTTNDTKLSNTTTSAITTNTHTTQTTFTSSTNNYSPDIGAPTNTSLSTQNNGYRSLLPQYEPCL